MSERVARRAERAPDEPTSRCAGIRAPIALEARRASTTRPPRAAAGCVYTRLPGHHAPRHLAARALARHAPLRLRDLAAHVRRSARRPSTSCARCSSRSRAQPGGVARSSRAWREIEETARAPRAAARHLGPARDLRGASTRLQLLGGAQRHDRRATSARALVGRRRLVARRHGEPAARERRVHLSLNLLGLLAVGSLVERALGTARHRVRDGARRGSARWPRARWRARCRWSACRAIVVGLLAALLWLELRFAERCPRGGASRAARCSA